ncbi:MAG TPA: PKD domain-containing protein [Gemmatimonadota bacterium]|nr:PKD domain-containing protein [Gemmatimonadota bacterium]
MLGLVRLAFTGVMTAVIAFSVACSSEPAGAPPYEIISPSTRNVVVPPGTPVRFEIRANGGRSVEYVIDDVRTERGPSFVLQPSAQHHEVQALILPADITSSPDVVLFTVEVEAAGNLPPAITSYTVEPVTGEAADTEFTAHVMATDPDGAIDSISVDFGDGTAPAKGIAVPFTATHTYATEGSYAVTARVVDDAGVPATSTRQITVAPHNDPPTGSLHSELATGLEPKGIGPLTVRLETSGLDVDGTIVTWKLDKDLGAGFELVGPNEAVTVTYPFRAESYSPVLRLTDDRGDSVDIGVDRDILVLRDVSASNSDVEITRSNPSFSRLQIAPAIWADGSDAFTLTIHIRDSEGSGVPDVPIRVHSFRPALIAPDGTTLSSTVIVLPEEGLTTDGFGMASVSISTNLSTRVEAMPGIGFQPFPVGLEVDLGHDERIFLEVEDQLALNAQTTVSDTGGRVFTSPSVVCPGEELEIVVEAKNDHNAPGGEGPAIGKFTQILYLNRDPLMGYRPLPGYNNWRTDSDGRIRFRYTPTRADDRNNIVAWVDGLPQREKDNISLKPPAECGGM